MESAGNSLAEMALTQRRAPINSVQRGLEPHPALLLPHIWRAEICTHVGRNINRNPDFERPVGKFSTVSVLLYRTLTAIQSKDKDALSQLQMESYINYEPTVLYQERNQVLFVIIIMYSRSDRYVFNDTRFKP